MSRALFTGTAASGAEALSKAFSDAGFTVSTLDAASIIKELPVPAVGLPGFHTTYYFLTYPPFVICIVSHRLMRLYPRSSPHPPTSSSLPALGAPSMLSCSCSSGAASCEPLSSCLALIKCTFLNAGRLLATHPLSWLARAQAIAGWPTAFSPALRGCWWAVRIA